MRFPFWPIVACISMLVLSACADTQVGSAKPLLAAGQSPSASLGRQGLWRYEDGFPECETKENEPVSRWPSCTNWFLVRSTDVATYIRFPKETWFTQSYVISDGEPAVVQLGQEDPTGDDGAVAYLFMGIEVLKRDASGRAISLRQWPALCGPPNETTPEHADAFRNNPITLAPLPGLHLLPDQDGCSADDVAAVRRAVALGRSSRGVKAHWVRDVRPDDFAQP